MESVCKSYGDSYGIDFRIARLFSVYGPELKKQLLWDICKKLKNSNSNLILGGTGEELRDWVHIKDVTAALELIGFNNNPNQSNYINVGSGIGTSVKQVAEIVRDIKSANFLPSVSALPVSVIVIKLSEVYFVPNILESRLRRSLSISGLCDKNKQTLSIHSL